MLRWRTATTSPDSPPDLAGMGDQDVVRSGERPAGGRSEVQATVAVGAAVSTRQPPPSSTSPSGARRTRLVVVCSLIVFSGEYRGTRSTAVSSGSGVRGPLAAGGGPGRAGRVFRAEGVGEVLLDVGGVAEAHASTDGDPAAAHPDPRRADPGDTHCGVAQDQRRALGPVRRASARGRRWGPATEIGYAGRG